MRWSLRGVTLVISEAHEGLEAAAAKVLRAVGVIPVLAGCARTRLNRLGVADTTWMPLGPSPTSADLLGENGALRPTGLRGTSCKVSTGQRSLATYRLPFSRYFV